MKCEVVGLSTEDGDIVGAGMLESLHPTGLCVVNALNWLSDVRQQRRIEIVDGARLGMWVAVVTGVSRDFPHFLLNAVHSARFCIAAESWSRSLNNRPSLA